MHFAVHGKTAAEIIHSRADAQKDFMGLTAWIGYLPQKSDAEVAKNYLSEEEIEGKRLRDTILCIKHVSCSFACFSN